jgi:hypothetical protein
MIQRPPASPDIALRRRLGCSLGRPRNPAAIDRPRTEEAVDGTSAPGRFRQLVIRLTDAEHMAFEAGARAAGQTMAVFARAQLAPHTRRKDAP